MREIKEKVWDNPEYRRAYFRKWRAKNHKKIRAYFNDWLKKNSDYYRKLYKEEPARFREIWKRHYLKARQSEPYKRRKHAHQLVYMAIKNGQLERKPCEKCGDIKVQGHHEDYSKPLQVNWLCIKHHAEIHHG